MGNLTTKKTLIVWFFTDDKPGHLNQLKGLESRLSAHTEIKSRWLSVPSKNISCFNILIKRFSLEGDFVPDLVVGAGSKTHKYLVAAKYSYNCFSLVLMRPSLPLSLFDGAVIPEHDNPPVNDKILVTLGVLNNIEPRAPRLSGVTENVRGLILIGGESKHYVWDDTLILKQLEQVLTGSVNVKEWVLSNSRRTPSSFLVKLKERNFPNISIVEHQDTESLWLPEQMAKSEQIWVTPDSVSMIYESITSGAATYAFDLQAKKESRVVRGIKVLLKKKLLSQWPDIEPKSQPFVLWEVERVVNWLLKRMSL
ncbi:mitochondrial fission ELM1 family protein [Alkalimarinus alittae]|uniref:Mitochondrial fission ELM1 family protein n=1 Tax=Alkalimarinus alittae TaxID=2961619 RepID=A0ABY6N186_9ALTE|nr:mitochondrial fission ELM1 family protein [Alkalimarinus alittae]UZE95764.1 mitochondrial fission ELM1 family protein [Alkalimarinus alittae]